MLTCLFVGWSILHEHFDLCNQHFDGDYWVHFDNGLDDLCYEVLVELPMILSEHWCETSMLTSDTFDDLYLMRL